ncbi:PAS domain-containing protein [uncultured Flavobacterium sp.]|uniref:PAS domain-containing protein n=1 Tax=uncultured Flavobacterium sp. TaxID=165435 RepID=UPI0030EDB804
MLLVLITSFLFIEVFAIKRPKIEHLSSQNFKETIDELIVFESLSDKTVSLRGQINLHNGYYLFIGNPWFQSMENVIEKKLTLHDFAIFDPLLDLLHVLKNQEINNSELKELLATVNSQRKKLKKDKEELNKLSIVASANKNGVVFTQPDGIIFWCNQAYLDLTEYTLEEIIGKTPIEVGLCELSNKVELNKMITTFFNGQTFDVKGFHGHKNEKPFWSNINGQPVFDKDGKLIQYFAIIEDISIEKESEEKLSILSSIADKNINAVVICNKNGFIEWVNGSFLNLTGYDREELVGRNPGIMLQGAETDSESIMYLSKQIKNGLPFNVEILNYKKNKNKYWVRIQGQALLDSNGQVIKYFAIEEDITLEKAYNQKIIESENKLNSLIENLQSGVLLEDENRKIVVVNKKFCSMFKIPIEPELMKGVDCEIAANDTKLFFKNSDEFSVRIDEILLRKEKIIAEEIELVDGRVFARSFLPIYKEGKYAGHLWSYDDVTIQKHYKESLELEKQKYSNILANMNLGLLEVDNNDVILFANQSFCNMSGFSLFDLLGKKAAELLLDPKDVNIIKEKSLVRESGISDSFEIAIQTKENKTKYWLISGAPNYDLIGKLIGSIGIHLDISDQRNLEIQKEQLLKRLEKQNEQLNEYAQIVSHDLKSPLRSIHSLITWIKEDNEKEFSDETLQYLNMIEGKVEKMDHLIHGILTYSKVDTEDTINESIDLNDVITNCIKIILIPENTKVIIDNQLPIVKADKFRIQQLFQNLNCSFYFKKIEDKLPNDLFLKVHRSFIINTKKIIDIEDNSVLIAKDVIPVSRANRPELMKRLNLL